MKKSSKSNDSVAKNIISGALLIGGLAIGLLGAGAAIAQANQSTDVSDRNKATNLSTRSNDTQYISDLAIPLSEIETEEDLVNLLVESGTQVLIDDSTGQMYLAYVNEDNYIEIVEISEEELSSLIQEISLISEEEEAVPYDRSVSGDDESIGIPREYWRTTGSESDAKKNRKRLDSEEGRKAIQEAREYVRNQKK